MIHIASGFVWNLKIIYMINEQLVHPKIRLLQYLMKQLPMQCDFEIEFPQVTMRWENIL